MNHYSSFFTSHTRLLLLTKYNYSTIDELNFISRLDLSLVIHDKKHLLTGLSALMLLTGKKVFSIKEKQSGNKYNKENKKRIKIKVLLKKNYLYFFCENLKNIYLPRLRYFKGFPLNSLTEFGNFSYKFKDLMVFPQLEEELEVFFKLKNLELNIILNKKLKNPKFFYSLFGFFFY